MQAQTIPGDALSTLNSYQKHQPKEVKPKKKRTQENGKEVLEKKLEALMDERDKHKESLPMTREKLDSAKAAIVRIKNDLKDTVREKMRENFGESSPSKALEQLLMMKLVTPESRQAEETRDKLAAKYVWHHEEVRRLDAEIQDVKKAISDIDADALTREVYVKYETWKELYFNCEDAFEIFKRAITDVRALDPAFTKRLSGLGIHDETFLNVIESRLNPDSISNGKSQAAVVNELTNISVIKDNPFYGPRKGIHRIDPRRETAIPKRFGQITNPIS